MAKMYSDLLSKSQTSIMAETFNRVFADNRKEAMRSQSSHETPSPASKKRTGHGPTPFDAMTQIKLQDGPDNGREGPAHVTLEESVAQPDSLMAEQFLKLRSTVAMLSKDKNIRSMLITSCLPGEGKTTVAINLAAAMAKGMDNSVILIDGDMRRKGLSSRSGLKDALGLSDVLTGKASLEESLVNSGIKGLSILPAGSFCSDPVEWISSSKMSNLLEQIKEEYEDAYIVVDSTPIVPTSEPNFLCRMVEGVLFVIRAEETRRDLVRRELRAIDPEKILGIVLNCADFETSSHYQNYYDNDPKNDFKAVVQRFFRQLK